MALTVDSARKMCPNHQSSKDSVVNRTHLVLAAVPFFLAACGGEPPSTPAPTAEPAAAAAPAPVSVEQAVEVSATVEKLDLDKRLLSLRDEAGEVFTVEVSPEVRNLAQVREGDRVVAQYYQALGVRLSTPDSPEAATIDLAGERAEPGERPAGAIGTRLTIPVTIVSAREDGKVVTFYREDGLLRVLEVKRPAAQEFVRGLKEGDKVEITYTEAVAVAVEPVSP